MNQLTCSVPNCARPSRLAGLCGAHHQRKLRHGDVRAHIPLKGTDVDPSAFWCSKCHTHKQKAAFHAEPRARRGISGVCKDCVKSRRDEIRPRLREQSKRAKTKDPEKTKRLKRESYLREDPEKRAARNRAWRTSDMERYRRQMRRDRAVRSRRARNAAGSCSQAQLTARWNYFGGKCWMCGVKATDTDHVKPLSKGGSNWPSNFRPACQTCNRSKSDKWPYPLEVALRESDAACGEGANVRQVRDSAA